jgi:exonuclease V gamma subunit
MQPGCRTILGNRLEDLVDFLADAVGRPLDDPLEPECVIVQSQGMARYLSLELAKRWNICANMRFRFPVVFFYDLFQLLLKDTPGEYPFAKEAMVWKLMDILPGFAEQFQGGPVAGYLSDGRVLKRYQLAEQIAYHFDQYLIFRPDMITAWERGETMLPGLDHEMWQSLLWRELVGRIGGDNHRASLTQRFLGRLATLDSLPKGFPQRISVFGISSLPPMYMNILSALGQHMPLDLYLLSPCKEYWADIVSLKEKARLAVKQGIDVDAGHVETGNDLLASLGRLGRDFQNLLVAGGLLDKDRQIFVEPGEDTLLHEMQGDILRMENPPEEGRGEFELDDSVRIASCHSPMREMEVLHDHLLERFQKRPELAPEDIVVMCPDIGTYAPYIQAVFGGRRGEATFIPFHIADQTREQEHPAVRGFFQVLDLTTSRFEASAVLSLLDSPFFREKAGLGMDDVDVVRAWVTGAGINWGTNETFKQQLGLPGYRENTWVAGIERMLLGVMMPGKIWETGDGKGLESGGEGLKMEGSAQCAVRSAQEKRWETGDGRPETGEREKGRRERRMERRMSVGANLVFAQTGTSRRKRKEAGEREAGEREAGEREAGECRGTACRALLAESRETRDRGRETAEGSGKWGDVIVPFDLIEGGQAEVLGRLVEFLRVLFAHVGNLDHPRSAGQWREDLTRLVRDLMQAGEVLAEGLLELVTGIEDVFARADGSGFDGELDFSTVRYLLKGAFKDVSSGGRFLSGGVTFCTLQPMRSIPFRVVCLAGLSDGAFPRQDRSPGFDLIRAASRKGDRSLRMDDRYLFLEALISARDEIYFSYLGQDVRDNTDLPPSVLLSEVMDYLDRYYPVDQGTLSEILTVKHRLQGFHPSYFDPDSCCTSYVRDNLEGAVRLLQPRISSPFIQGELADREESIRDLRLDALLAFWKNPARFLVQRRLGITLHAGQEGLQDVEPLERMDFLTGYLLGEELMHADQGQWEEAFVRARGTNVLPPGNMGRRQFDALLDDVAAMRVRVEDITGGAGRLEALCGTIVCANHDVQAVLGEVFSSGQVLGRFAKAKGKDFLAAWINHLALQLLAPNREMRTTWMIARDGTWRFDPVDDALSILENLLALFDQGQRECLHFFPESSHTFVVESRKDIVKGRKKAREKWLGSDYSSSEKDDAYFSLCFRDVDALDDRFEDLADRVFGPIVDTVSKQG